MLMGREMALKSCCNGENSITGVIGMFDIAPLSILSHHITSHCIISITNEDDGNINISIPIDTGNGDTTCSRRRRRSNGGSDTIVEEEEEEKQ